VALYEPCCGCLDEMIRSTARLGTVRERIGSARSTWCRQPLPGPHGSWIAIACTNDRCSSARVDPWASLGARRVRVHDERIPPPRRAGRARASWIGALDAAERSPGWTRLTSRAPGSTASGHFRDEHMRARENLNPRAGSRRRHPLDARIVPKLSRTPGASERRPGHGGAHNEEITAGGSGSRGTTSPRSRRKASCERHVAPRHLRPPEPREAVPGKR